MILRRHQPAVAALALGLMLSSAPHPTHAQVFEGVGVVGQVASAALLERSVGQIIQDAKDTANELLANAEGSGNVLMLRAADELNLAVDNALRQVDGVISDTLADLEDPKRDLLLGLAQATQAASDIAAKAYTFKDTLILDTRSLLGTLPFVKDTLVLQRVDGLSQLAGAQSYDLTVIGSYVGLPGEDHRTELSLSIDGTPLDTLQVDPQEIHIARLRIPNEALAPHFALKSTTFVPIELTVTQTFTERLWGFLWSVERVETYTAPLNLALYPAYAGTIEVLARHQIADWTNIAADTRDMTHADHCSSSCGGHYGTVHSVGYSANGLRNPPQIGDIRITSASCRQISGPGGQNVDEGTSVSPNGASATCRIRFRTQPSTYRLTVQRQQYAWVSEQDQNQEVEMYFGDLIEVRVPKTTTSIRVKGTFSTGEEIDILTSEANADALIQVIKHQENQNDRSVFLRSMAPEY